MSKIESIIEFECYSTRECYEWKPSDIEWMLRKQDVAEIAQNIKKLLLEEIKNAPQTWEDAIEVINDF